MAENKVSIIQKLQATPAVQIPNVPEVADRFKQLYVTFNGKDGARYYEAEKFHFAKLLQENPKLAACSKLSLYGCFLDVAVNGLSFDPAMKHLYMIPVSAKVKALDGTERWETRAQVRISGQGELHLRVKNGQVKYCDNPVLVYEGDQFSYGTKNGTLFIDHQAMIPRKSDNIIACYLRITRNDDTVDYKIFSMEEIQKLRNFSKDKDSLAWTSGLPGMVQTKTIKHAFRNYPKMRSLAQSKFTQLETDTVDGEAELAGDIYGLSEEPAAITNGAAQTEQPADKTPIQTAEVVTVDDDEFVKTATPVSPTAKSFDDDDF